jgi:hypothetical protein
MGVIAIAIAVMIGIENLSIAVSPLCGIKCWFPFSSLSYPSETIYFKQAQVICVCIAMLETVST